MERCSISAWVGIFCFVINTIKVLFPILYLDVTCKKLYFRPKKVYEREQKNINFKYSCTDSHNQSLRLLTDDIDQFN